MRAITIPLMMIITGILLGIHYIPILSDAQDETIEYNITYIINPENVTETADPLSIMKTYITVLDDYLNGINSTYKLQPLMVTNNGLPKDLRYSGSEFTGLLYNTLFYMDNMKLNYQAAIELIEKEDYEQAIEKLYQTGYYISKANITLGMLEESWPNMYTLLLKYSSDDIKPQLTEYVIMLRQLLQKIRLLLQQYMTLNIKTFLEVQKRLLYINQTIGARALNTTIEIYKYNSTVKPGHTLVVEGRLLLNDTHTPLMNKKIRIILIASHYIIFSQSVETNTSGYFVLKKTVPEHFVGIETIRHPYPGVYNYDALIVSIYQPEVNDTEKYRGSITTIQSNYMYIIPKLTVNGTSELMPGKEYEYTITHPAQNPLSITVSLPGVFKIKTVFSHENPTVKIQLPPNTPVGNTRLFFSTPIYKEYYEASYYFPVRIVMEDYIVELEKQKPIFYPFTEPVIKVKVLDLEGRPIPDAIVTADDNNVFYRDENGEFKIIINTGCMPIAPEKTVIVKVNTTKPWNPVKIITLNIPIINMVLIITGILYLAIIFLMGSSIDTMLGRPLSILYIRRKSYLKTQESELLLHEKTRRIKTLPIKPGESGEKTEIPTERKERTAYNLETNELYKKYIEILSRISSPKPYETLREYTSRIQGKIGNQPEIAVANRIFEKWIYGDKQPYTKELEELKVALRKLDAIIKEKVS